jgi:para-aminobenzoate synthetase component 1
MTPAPVIVPRPWRRSPRDLAAAWPVDRPLVMLHSARPHARWGRWSILATPEAFYRFDGRSAWHGAPPPGRVGEVDFVHEPIADLDRLLAAATVSMPRQSALPFHGGWIGFFGYELGRRLEPAAGGPAPPCDDRGWPLVQLAWCPRALVYDHVLERWYDVGGAWPSPPVAPTGRPDSWVSGPLRRGLSAGAYGDAVTRALEAIAAGDIFQANITQRFSATFEGSARAFALQAMAQSGAWFGALLELPGGRALASMSPELFLQVDPITRRVTTRPIKGTRPASRHPEELRRSAKDAAELHMIVDLMRNDLGRVCDFGSIRVTEARTIETHPTVHHGVGEVTGRLRAGVTSGDLLRATFPAGSVTGAPKIRAMQIIEALEPVPRGPYCGAIGHLDRTGRVGLSVAIRTIALTGVRESGRWDHLRGGLDYGAGGGIVADSEPEAEAAECRDKTAVLRSVLRVPPAAPDRPATPIVETPTAPSACAAAPRCGGRSGPPRSGGDRD